MFPDADDAAFSSDDELTGNSDREARWFQSEGVQERVRVVEIWYKHKGGWCWAVFSGNSILKEGQSPFKDDKGKDDCKYKMFSGNVDQDGDRYGFVRNLKSPQDGINAKQSKMQHILASKRLIITQGAVDDVEKTRAEWARPDGVVVTNRPVNEGVKADDQSFDFAGWVKMLELNQAEIENFGPNRTLLSEGGVDTRSGRAIQMLRQSGMAELGPFILAHRGWKIRVYRAIWNAIQQHWKAERWIRVTDDEGLAQFVQVNGLQIDPMTGQPTMVNAIGSLDVDIILDEAPDSMNMMQDLYETLQQVLPAVAPMLTPAQAQAAVALLVDASPIDSASKKKFKEAGEQQAQGPDPAVVQAQAELEMKAQQAQADMAIKAQASEHDMSLKERQAQLDAALDVEKAKLQAAIDADKHAREIGFERERMAVEFEQEAQRKAMDMDHERNKMAMAEQHDMGKMDREAQRDAKKIEYEITVQGIKSSKEEEDNDDEEENAAVEALKSLGKVGDRLIDKLDGIEKAFLAPTRIIKDAQGRPVAAEKVV